MLYKPTFPSPYAQCIALEGTEDEIVNFSCSMMGGSGIETARLKISDGDTQYYFDAVISVVSYTKKTQTSIYKNSGNYCLGGSSLSHPGLTYIYPVKEGVTYYISCQNNPIFCVCYHIDGDVSGSKHPLDLIYGGDVLHEFEYQADRDGYIYVNISKTKSSSVNKKINISVTGDGNAKNQLVPSVGRQNGVTDVKFSPIINPNNEYAGYAVGVKNLERMDNLNTSLTSIIKPNKDYIWQTRLYEAGSLNNDNHKSNIWLGYGVVESLNDSGANTNGKNYYYIQGASYQDCEKSGGSRICFKIRPHTNIQFPNATGGKTSLLKLDLKRLFNYYDDNARYYIKVDGNYYIIRDYRFYPPTSGEITSSHIDSYGEPLYGYAAIDYNTDDEEPIVKAGDQYEIYCNYIDSDEFYFNVADKPTITFTETEGNDISETTESKPYIMERSNLVLTGIYNHTSGAFVEKYSVELYKNTGTDENNKIWELIEQTEDIYDGELIYRYNMLMNGNEYKITVNTWDSLGFAMSKDIYLKVSYEVAVSAFTVNADYYSKHDSIIVEWNTIDPTNTFDNISYFEVYKQIGNNPKLHKVYTTSSNKETIIEDFVVGNLCDYTYIIYPIELSNDFYFDNLTEIITTDNMRIASPMSSAPIRFNYGATTIFGLVQDEEDLNTYTIDYNDMWRFEFNLENTGTTLNMDKTFVDSQNRFPKMMGGNRRYNTIPVKGLIGYYDCDKGDYVENYDLLEDWESFTTNNRLKLLKDRRGRLVPCDIESSSYEYMDAMGASASVSFSAKQLESLDNITILGRALILNPVKNSILTTSKDEVLTDSDIQVLISQES